MIGRKQDSWIISMNLFLLAGEIQLDQLQTTGSVKHDEDMFEDSTSMTLPGFSGRNRRQELNFISYFDRVDKIEYH